MCSATRLSATCCIRSFWTSRDAEGPACPGLHVYNVMDCVSGREYKEKKEEVYVTKRGGSSIVSRHRKPYMLPRRSAISLFRSWHCIKVIQMKGVNAACEQKDMLANFNGLLTVTWLFIRKKIYAMDVQNIWTSKCRTPSHLQRSKHPWLRQRTFEPHLHLCRIKSGRHFFGINFLKKLVSYKVHILLVLVRVEFYKY